MEILQYNYFATDNIQEDLQVGCSLIRLILGRTGYQGPNDITRVATLATVAPPCCTSINLPPICNVRSSCQATVKHDRLFLCRTGVLPITAAPATKLACIEGETKQDWEKLEKLCRRKVWYRMEHQNKHFSPGRRVGQWAPWFSKHTWSTWVSRSKSWLQTTTGSEHPVWLWATRQINAFQTGRHQQG